MFLISPGVEVQITAQQKSVTRIRSHEVEDEITKSNDLRARDPIRMDR
jgi:hypothetical protein